MGAGQSHSQTNPLLCRCSLSLQSIMITFIRFCYKKEHDALIVQLADLREKLENGKTSISFELAHFLKIWLTKHIMDVDKAYTPHFLAQGIRPELAQKSWVQKLWDSVTGRP